MAYSPLAWQNNVAGTGNPGAVNATRLGHMDAGIATADANATLALTKISNQAVFNVLDYGAVGDGVTDDSAAIQAAINAVPQADPDWGGTIYFPPGRYKCDSSLDISGKAGLKFEGQWGLSSYETNKFGAYLVTGTPGMTLIRAWGAGSFTGSTPGRLTADIWHYGSIFEGLTFQDAAGGSTLIDSVATNRMKFIRCSFRDATVGVSLLKNNLDSSWHRFDDCIFHDCTTGVYCDSFHTYFSGGEIFDCGVGVDILPHASKIHFTGTKADQGNPCFRVRGSYCTWTGVGWETTNVGGTFKGWDINGDAGFVGAGIGNMLIGCHANGASGVNNNSWSVGSLAYQTLIAATYADCNAPTDSGFLTQLLAPGDGTLGALTVREGSSSYIQKWQARFGPSQYDQFEIQVGRVRIGNAIDIIICSGTPESAVIATPGSLALDYTNGEQYIKKTGTGNTGWKLVTHA